MSQLPELIFYFFVKVGYLLDNLAWIQRLQLEFNPFAYLEASKDPRLGQYLVGNEAYDLARDDQAAVVFSPPGGGKTAMRIYVTRSCWQSLSGSHPFPVPYVLPYYLPYVQKMSLEQHLQWLVVAGGKALLAGLLYRPERFLEISLEAQGEIAGFLNSVLMKNPGLQTPLAFYLDLLEESYCPDEVVEPLGWQGVISEPPPPSVSHLFATAMRRALNTEFNLPSDVEGQWALFVNIIFSMLGFRSIFILVDGIDAFPETSEDLQAAFELIEALFFHQKQFAESKVFLKAFFPVTKEEAFAKHFPVLGNEVEHFALEWTPQLLAAMLRKRVHVASGGMVDSLDAYSTPDVFNIEEKLAEAVVPLPREALRLTQFLIRTFEAHLEEGADSISMDDFFVAVEQYHTQLVLPGDLCLSQEEKCD